MSEHLVKAETDFTSFYDLHAQGVYNFIYYRTAHKQTAEDLTSQTFLKALENWNRFLPEKASFKTWLYTIARNTVIDYYRTSKTIGPLEDAETNPAADSLQTEIDGRLAAVEARKYLMKLEAEERELVIMRIWDELSYEEISQITGKSIGASKMMFSRIISKLQ